MMNSYEVLVFGICKEILGKEKVSIYSENPLSCEEFQKKLIEIYPRLNEIPSLRISADYEFIEKNTILNFNSEIALIPPVSGG